MSNLIKVDFNPQTKQLRQFGWVGLVAFAALGGLAYWRHKLFVTMTPETAAIVAKTLWGLAGYCGVFAAAWPAALRPLYVGLMVATYPIGLVLSNVILGIIFYGVFLPVGLVFRLIGRDAMHRRMLPQATSYWEKRTPVTDPKRYFRQF